MTSERPETQRLSMSTHVGWLMNRLNSVRSERLRTGLKEWGISARGLGVLSALVELPPPVSQQEIASRLVLDQGSVAIVADELEKMGLIRRDRDPRNRRRYIVALTDAGRATWSESRELMESAEQSMVLGLTAAEVVELTGLLRRVAKEHGIV